MKFPAANRLTLHHFPLMCRILLGSVLWNSLASAYLVIQPQNAVSLEWTPVTITCTTTPNDSCHWLSKTTLNSVTLTIYDGDQQKLNTRQYHVNTSLPGQCDLTILKPSLSGSLVYGCTYSRFGEPSYASLTVLKSNLLCADNVQGGTTGYGQRERHSLYLVYASELGVSLYVQHSNGSVEKICSEAKKDSRNGQVHSV